MTDAATPPAPNATAGSLLREARKAQGLHIAALATTLKIPVRKLEALEADRYQDLPDPAFTRALAQAACRALKIESAPVLALMPLPNAALLDQVSAGLNTPFRDRQSGDEATFSDIVRSPAVWFVLVLAIGALAVYFWPTAALVVAEPVAVETPAPLLFEPAAPAPAMPASVGGAAEAEPVAVAPVDVVPAPVVAEASTPAPAPAIAAPATPSLLAVNVTGDSWIEVTEAGGRTVLSRLVRSGEALSLDGRLPLRVTVGNAKVTTLLLRGVAVDLAAGTRDNVARLELR